MPLTFKKMASTRLACRISETAQGLLLKGPVAPAGRHSFGAVVLASPVKISEFILSDFN